MKLFSRRPEPAFDAARVGRPRILAYCASNVGLGHYARLTRVIGEVRRARPECSVLLATDAHEESLAERAGAAVLRLPGFHFTDAEEFKEKPCALGLKKDELRDLRAEVLLSLARGFAPDVVLMDTNPHGKRDELLPLLKHLKGSAKTRTALMMRAIPSPPGERFKLSGEAAEVRRHADYYDRLLIAGDKGFFDAAATYAWPPQVAAKLRYVGFVIEPAAKRLRAERFAAYPGLRADRPTVVAAFGGGWQIQPHADLLLEGLQAHRRQRGAADAQMLLVTGPAVETEALEMLRRRAADSNGVVIDRFNPAFPDVLAAADFAILQAGSTPFQILDGDIPMLLTCRDYKSAEQRETAKRLAAFPGVRLADGPPADAAVAAEWFAWGLSQPRQKRRTGFDFNGAANAAAVVLELIDNR